jgi:hypothetical protein
MHDRSQRRVPELQSFPLNGHVDKRCGSRGHLSRSRRRFGLVHPASCRRDIPPLAGAAPGSPPKRSVGKMTSSALLLWVHHSKAKLTCFAFFALSAAGSFVNEHRQSWPALSTSPLAIIQQLTKRHYLTPWGNRHRNIKGRKLKPSRPRATLKRTTHLDYPIRWPGDAGAKTPPRSTSQEPITVQVNVEIASAHSNAQLPDGPGHKGRLACPSGRIRGLLAQRWAIGIRCEKIRIIGVRSRTFRWPISASIGTRVENAPMSDIGLGLVASQPTHASILLLMTCFA